MKLLIEVDHALPEAPKADARGEIDGPAATVVDDASALECRRHARLVCPAWGEGG